MAARSLEGANLTWQRVDEFMRLQQSPTAPTSPIARALFLRDLKGWLATQFKNPKLQYVSFSNLTVAVNIMSSAATLYALFMKKQNTATAAYPRFNDNAATTVGGANAANVSVAIFSLLNGGDEVSFFYGNTGITLANGLAAESSTTLPGGVDSNSGDGPNGFAIFG